MQVRSWTWSESPSENVLCEARSKPRPYLTAPHLSSPRIQRKACVSSKFDHAETPALLRKGISVSAVS
jgi:hypothetical protein